jgi:predicted PurR-regulated permease PerM
MKGFLFYHLYPGSIRMKGILQRINQYLLFGILLTVALYYGKIVLVPIVFGIMLAMLMTPVCRRLDSKGWPRAASCTVCIIILLVALCGLLGIVVAEVKSFVKDIALIEEKARETIRAAQDFIEEKFHIEPEQQAALAKKQVDSMSSSAGTYISMIFGGMASAIGGILLTLAYTFLFIYNKERYETFFIRLYKNEDPRKVKEIVGQVSHVAQQYLTGRAMSVATLTVLYAIGLLIIGIKNALLLSAIAALLTIVPYIGSAIGGLFPCAMALVTEDSIQPALWVIGVITFIQAIDNYFIEPRMVGGEVNLSALVSIMSIIVGGLIWGVAGMILFIPMLGIAKIVFDHVESLKPYGYLIGDPDENRSPSLSQWIAQKFKKK